MSHSGRSRLLAAGWMMLIFFLSSQSSLPAVSSFSGADLLLHAVFYAILCVFFARSFTDPRIRNWNRMILLTILVIVYGITDEYHQSFVPGRDASIWDVLADGVGGFLAAAMLFGRDRKTVNISEYNFPNESRRV